MALWLPSWLSIPSFTFPRQIFSKYFAKCFARSTRAASSFSLFILVLKFCTKKIFGATRFPWTWSCTPGKRSSATLALWDLPSKTRWSAIPMRRKWSTKAAGLTFAPTSLRRRSAAKSAVSARSTTGDQECNLRCRSKLKNGAHLTQDLLRFHGGSGHDISYLGSRERGRRLSCVARSRFARLQRSRPWHRLCRRTHRRTRCLRRCPSWPRHAKRSSVTRHAPLPRNHRPRSETVCSGAIHGYYEAQGTASHWLGRASRRPRCVCNDAAPRRD